MKRSSLRTIVVALSLLAGACSQPAREPQVAPPEIAQPVSRSEIVPLVDHHQHLISAGTMAMITRPGTTPLPPITARDVVSLLDSAGIRRGVVLSGAFTFGGRNFDRQPRTEEELHRLVAAENDWTATEVAQYPDRLVAFCSFHPQHGYALAELERCAGNRLFRGVKLHLEESDVDLTNPVHAESVRRVFGEANRHGLAIVIHPRNNRVDAVATTRVLLTEILPAAPDVPVQIAHLSGGGQYSEPALALYAEAVTAGAPGTRNLLFDLTDVANTARESGAQAEAVMGRMVELIRAIGIERMVYGSDPAVFGRLAPREAWALLRDAMPLTDAEIAAIAGNVAPYLTSGRR